MRFPAALSRRVVRLPRHAGAADLDGLDCACWNGQASRGLAERFEEGIVSREGGTHGMRGYKANDRCVPSPLVKPDVQISRIRLSEFHFSVAMFKLLVSAVRRVGGFGRVCNRATVDISPSTPATVEGLRHRTPNAECRYQDRWHAAAALSMLFQISLGAILGFDSLDFLQEQTDVPADTLDVDLRGEFKV